VYRHKKNLKNYTKTQGSICKTARSHLLPQAAGHGQGLQAIGGAGVRSSHGLDQGREQGKEVVGNAKTCLPAEERKGSGRILKVNTGNLRLGSGFQQAAAAAARAAVQGGGGAAGGQLGQARRRRRLPFVGARVRRPGLPDQGAAAAMACLLPGPDGLWQAGCRCFRPATYQGEYPR
jgi:hypothetical protein